MFSRIYALHFWLQGWCENSSVSYVNNWRAFWERPAFYRRDGLHLSRCGSIILSENIGQT